MSSYDESTYSSARKLSNNHCWWCDRRSPTVFGDPSILVRTTCRIPIEWAPARSSRTHSPMPRPMGEAGWVAPPPSRRETSVPLKRRRIGWSSTQERSLRRLGESWPPVRQTNGTNSKTQPAWTEKAGAGHAMASGYGIGVDIAAPGVHIYATDIMGAAGYGAGNY